jgi:hypothetical protein
MKRVEEFYSGYLLNRLPPREIFARRPATGHTFEHYASQEAAFEGKLLPFDDRVAQRIGQWFERHR